MNALQKCYLAKRLHFIAIDEGKLIKFLTSKFKEDNTIFDCIVHCVSQYGNDFRPDYKFLGTLKTLFPDIPLLSVTATATTKVIVDIRKMLNLPQPIILKADFNRPNLYYHVSIYNMHECILNCIFVENVRLVYVLGDGKG